jgi:hypothetical protein
MTRRSRFLAVLMFLVTIGLAWPSDVAAQRRAVPRTGVAVPRTTFAPRYYRPYYPGYYYPRFYSPWYYPYYPSFAFGIGFGFGSYWGPYGYPYYGGYPYGGYGYGYGYPYYGYPYYAYESYGSARLNISPRNAQVYIDGDFVGLVDDFDGSFQRLNVPIGEHDLQVYLEGHRTFSQKVLFTRGTTMRFDHTMQPLAPGDPAEPKPQSTRATMPPPDPYQKPAPPARPGEQTEFGTLSLRVNPADAVILIDGEAWDRPQGESRFSIDLTEGLHQVEIRKEGYRPYVRTVDVRRSRTFSLNVSLSPGAPDNVPGATRGETVRIGYIRVRGF